MADNSLDSFEQKTLKELIFAGLKEQRRTRRWSILFKVLTFSYILALTVWFFYEQNMPVKSEVKFEKHTALVDIRGIITEDSDSRAELVSQGILDAAKSKNVKGIILRINTPGGSPVQARLIYQQILRIKAEYKKPIYACIEDQGTSAGYLIASATDKIYADPTSLVGSIGVVLNGFGFVDSLKLLGMERRLLVAGEHKALFDPFSPAKAEDKQFVQSLLNDVHQQFITDVQNQRKNKIKQDSDAYTGKFWTGRMAKELGLVDEIGDIVHIATKEFQATKTVNYTVKADVLQRLLKKFGVQVKALIQSTNLQFN